MVERKRLSADKRCFYKEVPDKLYNVLESYSRKKGKEITEIVKEWTKLMVWEDKKKEALSAY